MTSTATNLCACVGPEATTQNGFDQLEAISSDPARNIWVGDTGNTRLLEFMPPFTTDMPASLVIGQQNFTTSVIEACFGSSPCNTRANGFAGVGNHPAFDSLGNLWVADYGNNRVLEFASTPVPEFPTASLAIVALVSLAVVAVVARRSTFLRQPQ